MRTYANFITYLSLLCILGMESGCAVTLKPTVHTVPYQSDVTCSADSDNCPWKQLQEQAKFSALINCLLAGANILQTDTSENDSEDGPLIIVPTPPKYGFDSFTRPGGKGQCSMEESSCMVASRYDHKLTWAGCGSKSLDNEKLRGGEHLDSADHLKESTVLTGSLETSADTFPSRKGLDGPDQFYTFTLAEKTNIEIAIAANSSEWSQTKGHRSAWQPGLFLLGSDGRKISEGKVWRAGVTYLLPQKLAPGTYYLVVDSSQREFIRGDGLYRLYLGLNNNHMGSVHPE